MFLQVQTYEGKSYIECRSSTPSIRTAEDLLRILTYAGEHETNLLYLHESDFNPDFFDLKLGLAGEILQKFSNYHVKAAIIGTFITVEGTRFQELISECNRGSNLKFTDDVQKAIKWLTR